MANKPIKILTYNICWDCMSMNSTSRNSSTAELARQCRRNSVGNNTSCLNNIVKLIDSQDHDIIGLQEASNWHTIKNTSNKLNNIHKMGYVQSKSGTEDMITFINIERFKLIAAKHGQIHAGRPYQIIFLKENSTNNYFIVVNLHNGKDDIKKNAWDVTSKKSDIEIIISKNINMAVRLNERSIVNLESATTTDISDILNNHTFHTIVLGDFNDLNRDQHFWNDLKIFKDTPFNNLKHITVTTIKEPPKSCCTKHIRRHEYEYFGDYICIDKSKLKFKEKNQRHPHYKLPSGDKLIGSDHLPIYAEVEIISPSNTSNQSPSQSPSQPPSQPPRQSQRYPPSQSQRQPPIHHLRQNVVVPQNIKQIFGSNIKYFTINIDLRLRLLDDISDPNKPNNPNYNTKYKFKGESIKKDSILIYPSGFKYNDYVFVMCISNTHVIGYINARYLVQNGNMKYNGNITFKLNPNYKNKILKFIPTTDNPENNVKIKGLTILPDDILIIPCGEVTPNDLVIIQDIYNPSNIGYIKKNYLINIS